MRKTTESKLMIQKFMIDFASKQLEFPTPERISHQFPDMGFENISTIVNSLFTNGDLADAAANMKQRLAARTRAANTNRPDNHTANIIRSGVKELPRKVLEAKAYPVDVLKAKFADGMVYRYAFTVDHSRGFAEYNEVKNQNIVPIYSEYAESLVDGMFRNWN